MKLSVKHTLHIKPEGYQEAHNEGPQAYPALVYWYDLK